MDTHILNSCGLGVAIFKACEELGVKCETKELLLPNTVVWKRKISESTISDDVQVSVTVSLSCVTLARRIKLYGHQCLTLQIGSAVYKAKNNMFFFLLYKFLNVFTTPVEFLPDSDGWSDIFCKLLYSLV